MHATSVPLWIQVLSSIISDDQLGCILNIRKELGSHTIRFSPTDWDKDPDPNTYNQFYIFALMSLKSMAKP